MLKNHYRFINHYGFFLPVIIFLVLISISNAQPARDTLAPTWGKTVSPFANDITTLKADSNGVLYMGMWGGGMRKSGNEGLSWTIINNGLSNLFITGFDIDSAGVYWATTFGGGVFRSTNQGLQWNTVNSGLTTLKIKTVICKKGGPVFVGTLGGGIFRTTNGGSYWEQVNNGLYFWDINTMMVNSDGVVLAGTNGDGIYRTDDNGNYWRRSNGSLTSKNITSFCMNDLNEIICGTYGGGVNYSVSSGLSWTEYKHSNLVKNISCVAFNPDQEPVAGLNDFGVYKYDSKVYEDWRKSDFYSNGINCIVKMKSKTMFIGVPYLGLYKSTNGGVNWIAATTPFNLDTTIYPLLAGPNGMIVGGTTDGFVNVSTNFGETWNKTDLKARSFYAFAFDSVGSIYASIKFDSSGNGYGKLLVSGDKGATWSAMLVKKDTSFEQIGIKAGGFMLLGLSFPAAQTKPPGPSSMFMKSTNYGLTWSNVAATAASGGFRFIKFNAAGDVFTVMNNNSLYRSQNNGSTWTRLLDSTQWANDIAFDSKGNVYVATDQGIYKTPNMGGTWTKSKFGFTYPVFKYILVTDRDVIYAAFDYGIGIMRSDNYGISYDSVNVPVVRGKAGGLTFCHEGYVYIGTSKVYRTIEPPDLVPPTIIAPVDLSGGASLNPTLVWNSADKAQMYEVQISVEYDFNNVFDYFTIGDTMRTLSKGLDYNTTYYWRIRSRNNNSLSDWSKLAQFTTVIKYPILISPANNSAAQPLTVTCTWHKVDGAGAYKVQISKDPSFATFVANKDVTDTTFKVVSLELYTKYYWRVQAKASKTVSDWSETWQFTTKLKSPGLVAPPNKSYGQDTICTMHWIPSDGATGCDLQIAKDSLFKNIIFDGETSNIDSHTTKLLQYFTKYWWRVRTKNSDGVSDWSEGWSFITVIQSPQLLSPLDATVDLKKDTIPFVWLKDNDAQYYHIQVAKDASFNSIVFEDSSSTGTTKSFGQFDYFTTYYWRVRILVKPYDGLWSEVRSFTTGIAAPLLTSPTDKKDSTATDLIFNWEQVTGADFYEIQIAKNQNFNGLLADQDSIYFTRYEYPNFAFATDYFWRVRAKYSNGISDWSDIWSFKTQPEKEKDVIDPLIGFSAKIYPNPAVTFVNFGITIAQPAQFSLTISDLSGKSLTTLVEKVLDSGSYNFTWNAENFASGSYIFKISVNGKMYSGIVNIVK